MMTGGQTKLNLASGNSAQQQGDGTEIIRLNARDKPLKIIKASADELMEHEKRLDIVEKAGGKCLWREL